MRHPLPSGRGGRQGLGDLNAMLSGKAVSAASQIDQSHSDAVARISQSPIRNTADGRLVHASRLRQLSLAEPLSFE